MWVSRNEFESLKANYEYLYKEHFELANLVWLLLGDLKYRVETQPKQTTLIKGE